MMHFRSTMAIALAAVLAGCGTLSVSGKERVKIGNAYTVEPQIEWNRASEGNREIWTADGLPLQAIHFVKGVRKGGVLIASGRGQATEDWPRFNPQMTPTEVEEFVVDSLSRLGIMQLQPHNLRPQAFGKVQGFRFDFDFLYSSGLEGQGLAVGAVIGKKLQLILYIGARQHYYPAYLDKVEAIIRSIQPT